MNAPIQHSHLADNACPICDQPEPCRCGPPSFIRPSPSILPRRGITRPKVDGYVWAPVNYTRFECNDEHAASLVRKRATLAKDGALVLKPAEKHFWNGRAIREQRTLRELGQQLNAPSPPSKTHAFYCSGVSKESEPGEPLPMGSFEKGKKRSRSKEQFPFPEQNALLVIDSDSLHKWPEIQTPEDLVDVIAQIEPALDADCVTSTSGSSFIEGPRDKRGLRGNHAFYPIDKGAEIPRVLEALHVRAWLAGYGCILVTQNGCMLPRSILDTALASPNQPIYEFGAVLQHKAIKQHRQVNPHLSLSGQKQIQADKVATLTEAERAEYARLVEAAKAAMRGEAERVTAAWLDQKTDKLPPEKREAAQAALLEQRDNAHRDLAPDFPITLDDGRVLLVRELLEQAKASPDTWHKMRIPDPFEPEYGKSKATIFTKDQRDGRVRVLSFAHGGSGDGQPVVYFLEPRPDARSDGFDAELFDGEEGSRVLRSGALLWFGDDGSVGRDVASLACNKLVHVLQGRLAWARGAMNWHMWDGACWSPQESGAAANKILHDLVDIGCADFGFSAAYVKGIEDVLKMGDRLPLPEWDDSKLIPFRNGVLDATTREFLPASSKNGNTWALPYDYDPGATCPRVLSWLRDAMGGDDEMVEYSLAALAAILTGRADLQVFFYLYGPGGTGKSTFIRLAMEMVGGANSYTTTLKDLETNRFETACLYGKRLTVINDAGKYGESVDKLKAATGEDWLRNEKKHVQQSGTSSFIYKGMITIVANVRFATTDQTSGLERRYRGIDFDVVLTDEQKRLWAARGGEAAMLHAEMPGLVNRLLKFSREDVARILNNPPTKSARSNFEAKKANNPIARWMVESCVPDQSHHAVIGHSREIRTSDGEMAQRDGTEHLYPSFLVFCAREKVYTVGRERFNSTLEDTARSMGCPVLRKRSPGKRQDSFRGIRLRRESEPRHRWHDTMCDEELLPTPDPFED